MRRSEWLLAAYFTYITLLSQILKIPPDLRLRTLIVNTALMAIYGVLLGPFRRTEAAEHLRNWIPLGLMLLAYKEVGWLAPSAHDHHLENGWIVWDRALLRDWHLRRIIESTGPGLPGLLEACYVLVYALPCFTMVMLYVYRRSKLADGLLIIYLLGLFLSYVQFPFWPSEPPRVVFPGEDAPRIDTLLRQFNHWILGGYGIHTSVFPSAHVSGAVAAAFAMKRIFTDRPWLYRGVFVYAALVATATVYGRYHYAADAAAGVVVGVFAAWLGARIVAGRAQTPSDSDPPEYASSRLGTLAPRL